MDKKRNEDIYAYNDKIISFITDVAKDEIQYVLLQKCNHTNTCMKVSNWHKTCLFSAPLLPITCYNKFETIRC